MPKNTRPGGYTAILAAAAIGASVAAMPAPAVAYAQGHAAFKAAAEQMRRGQLTPQQRRAFLLAQDLHGDAFERGRYALRLHEAGEELMATHHYEAAIGLLDLAVAALPKA
jgi:hypothetical protein